MSRPAKVEELVTAALDGMQSVGPDFTAGELASAAFTLALRVVKVMTSGPNGPSNVPQIRQALQDVWAELPKEVIN